VVLAHSFFKLTAKKMTPDTAELIDELIKAKGFRSNALRLELLRVLLSYSAPVDSKQLAEKLHEQGYELSSEDVRLQLKRLNNAGVLIRFPQKGKNKVLVQLRPIQELIDESKNDFNPRNTSFT
jgi:Fe2+ or Zn2+ uptake regulation protein